ncbi:IS66 family insertion sequence element accessory protein TnpB [Paenibacillus dendritiformis]|uniref:IS66 family insertion sequence element accessory protein TnpB n=1 Tax=Paenibacillus dendritiformis TaxID=130049 RepID=UPI00143DB86B|nr:IS66 family insertion sequence element accessory protein TnpB [Paenibacillus dendritiformis]NRF99259.1 IS66 family insertion sequence element accessory protein TnpB [Paenibacillus dendritiformis]
MLNFTAASPVYLACGATDMRKSIDGLAAIVQEQFELNPFSSALFVFCNRLRIFWFFSETSPIQECNKVYSIR